MNYYFSEEKTPKSKLIFCVGAPVKRKNKETENRRVKKRRLTYDVKTRKGMSVAVDSAFQKRGFNSLTGTVSYLASL